MDEDFNYYSFNDLLFELERTGEILRQFEAGECPVTDDCSLSDDDNKNNVLIFKKKRNEKERSIV